MKRIFALIICSVLLISVSICFVGCGSNNSSTPDEKQAEAVEKETKPLTEKATEKPSQKPTEKPTEVPKTEHQHDWENITNTIHHSAETEKEWIVDKPAEYIDCYIRTYYCTGCFQSWKYDSGLNSISKESEIRTLAENNLEGCIDKWIHDSFAPLNNKPVLEISDNHYTKEIPEQGHYEDKVIKEAYDETKVTGKRCKDCGVTEMFDE